MLFPWSLKIAAKQFGELTPGTFWIIVFDTVRIVSGLLIVEPSTVQFTPLHVALLLANVVLFITVSAPKSINAPPPLRHPTPRQDASFSYRVEFLKLATEEPGILLNAPPSPIQSTPQQEAELL